MAPHIKATPLEKWRQSSISMRSTINVLEEGKLIVKVKFKRENSR